MRRLPVLLLLGLVAMLLWGQCARLLYPYSATHTRILAGYIVSIDSLCTKPPATLYLTLALRNGLRQPVMVAEVAGTLLFNSRAFPFSATAQLHHTPLAAGAKLQQAVAIAVSLPPDSLALLRQQLQTDHFAPTGPHLSWQVGYNTQRALHARVRTIDSSLPLLLSGKKATGTKLAAPVAPR